MELGAFEQVPALGEEIRAVQVRAHPEDFVAQRPQQQKPTTALRAQQFRYDRTITLAVCEISEAGCREPVVRRLSPRRRGISSHVSPIAPC
ncbi:hypothetical protein SRO_1153 [Streptomyces rochei]|nr:hypothetical protein SRO_1153 [Streptomyces rochei]